MCESETSIIHIFIVLKTLNLTQSMGKAGPKEPKSKYHLSPIKHGRHVKTICNKILLTAPTQLMKLAHGSGQHSYLS
jgi:hypothetical protein